MFGQAFNSGFFIGPNYIYKEDIFGDSSCIGLYTMDYDFSDSSGNDNDMGLTVGNPNHGVSGGLNLGARFDGYNTAARAYPVSDLQGLTSVSISFWFKWDDSASVSNYGHMVNIGDMGGLGNGDAFGIAVGNDGASYNRVLYGFFPEGSLSTGQTVTDNVWHHVLMTYSGTTIKYYYDGNSTPIATQTRTSLSLPNSAVNRISVGHYAYNGNHHFKGDLDHLRVFNREIQSSELATLYNEKFYSPAATTTDVNYPVTNTAYYKLDNNAKSSNAAGHYLFIGDAGASNSSGRLNSIDSEFTYTRPAGYSEWGGSWDPNNKAGTATQTFEENNKKWTKSGTYYNGVWSTNQYSSGKYYAEIEFLGIELNYGISKLTSATGFNTNLQNNSIFYGSWGTSSWKYSTTNTSEGVVLSTNDVIGLAADFDNQILTVYRNNILFDTVSIAGHDGTETDIEYRFGRFGQAAVFNGSSSKIVLPNGVISFSTFSVSAWCNVNSSGVENSILEVNDSNTYPNHTTLLLSAGSSAPRSSRFLLRNYTTNEYNYNPSGTPLTGWNHYAMTYDGSTVKSYINGSLVDSGNLTFSNSVGSISSVNIGLSASTRYLNGSIDQVRIFSSALDSDQVTKLYNEKPETDTSTFKTVLYEANASTNFISNVGFQPDLVWTKSRDNAYNHLIYDSIRGAGNYLQTNTNIAQAPFNANTLSSFEATGFILGNVDNSNYSSGTSSVAWCWKAGGDAVSNTNGSITSQVSANTEAGFSIVKYTGNGTSGATVGHGLSSQPDFIIVKNIDSGTANWLVKDFATMTDGRDYIYLNENYQIQTTTSSYFVTGRSSTTFTVGNSGQTNNSGSEHIAYCFHSVSGVSKVGSYTGAGSGTRVYTTSDGTSTGTGGFRPSWVMLKNASVSGTGYDWYIYDVRRNDGDGDDNLESYLTANNSTAEITSNTGSNGIVMEDDGFTLDINATAINGSGNTFIYLAFK